MEITFNKNESVRAITEQEFLATRDYQDRKLGVGNLSAYKEVVEAISSAGLGYEVQDIYIQKRAISKPSQREVAREGYISDWDAKGLILNKYIVRLGYKNGGALTNNEYQPSIALAFNEDKMEIAQGVNVKVCSNMNILNAQRHVKSWGRDTKHTWDEMIGKVIEWMGNAIINFKDDVDRIVQLQSISIGDPIAVLEQMSGLLHVMVEQDLINKTNSQIVNHSVTNEFIRLVIGQYNAANETNMAGGLITAYDFYQSLTDASSHQAELTTRISSTIKAFNFIEEYFSVNEVFGKAKENVDYEEALVVDAHAERHVVAGIPEKLKNQPVTQDEAYPSHDAVKDMINQSAKSDTQAIVHAIGNTPSEDRVIKEITDVDSRVDKETGEITEEKFPEDDMPSMDFDV